MTMLVDSHCHLDFPDYAGSVAAVMDRARAAGVGTCLSIGTQLSRFPGVRAVAEAFPDIWCSVGVHPHEAEKELLQDAGPLLAETLHPKVVGIGETGLDYYYEHSPRAPQIANFRAHIDAALALGFSISVSGIATFKNSHALRDIIKKVPLDRLLVETDAPYLAPVPHRGKTNEPAFVTYTAKMLADLKGVSESELAAATTENFFRLFTKAKPPA